MDKPDLVIACAETNISILAMTLVFLGLAEFLPTQGSQFSLAAAWRRRRTAPIRVLVACMTLTGMLGFLSSVVAGVCTSTPMVAIAVSFTVLTGVFMGASVSIILVQTFRGEK